MFMSWGGAEGDGWLDGWIDDQGWTGRLLDGWTAVQPSPTRLENGNRLDYENLYHPQQFFKKTQGHRRKDQTSSFCAVCLNNLGCTSLPPSPTPQTKFFVAFTNPTHC
jgi:hypothetical protein